MHEIRKLFTAGEIRAYLDHLERTKFLAPPEPDLDVDDLDEEAEEAPWPDSLVVDLHSSTAQLRGDVPVAITATMLQGNLLDCRSRFHLFLSRLPLLERSIEASTTDGRKVGKPPMWPERFLWRSGPDDYWEITHLAERRPNHMRASD